MNGGMQGPATAARESQVADEFNRLEQEIESLQPIIASLESRLAFVLRPTEAKNPPSRGADRLEPVGLVPLADRLRRSRMSVTIIGGNLINLRDCLEI